MIGPLRNAGFAASAASTSRTTRSSSRLRQGNAELKRAWSGETVTGPSDARAASKNRSAVDREAVHDGRSDEAHQGIRNVPEDHSHARHLLAEPRTIHPHNQAEVVEPRSPASGDRVPVRVGSRRPTPHPARVARPDTRRTRATLRHCSGSARSHGDRHLPRRRAACCATGWHTRPAPRTSPDSATAPCTRRTRLFAAPRGPVSRHRCRVISRTSEFASAPCARANPGSSFNACSKWSTDFFRCVTPAGPRRVCAARPSRNRS